MPNTAMTEFLTAAQQDQALAGRLREAVASNDPAAAVEAIADLAASAGFEVGPSDVEAFRRNALAEIEGELSDSSLDSVSGGTVVYAEPIDDPFVPTIGGGSITPSTIGIIGLVPGGGNIGNINDWLKNW